MSQFEEVRRLLVDGATTIRRAKTTAATHAALAYQHAAQYDSDPEVYPENEHAREESNAWTEIEKAIDGVLNHLALPQYIAQDAINEGRIT